MPVLSSRIINIMFAGNGLNSNHSFPAADNTPASPAGQFLLPLAVGDNLIHPPIGAQGCTIIPPTTNTVGILLKGAPADVGIPLHRTDPTSIGLLSLSPGFQAADFYLEIDTPIFPVRIVWS